MRTAFSGVSLAPSPAVLRFLKIQTETLCFLHTSKRPVQPRIPRRSFRARLDSQQFSSTSRISVSRQGQIRLCASPTNDSSTNAANPSSRPRIAQGRCLQKESVRRASSWSAKGKDKPWETWRARRAADAKGLGPNHLPSPLSLEDTGSIGRAIKPGSELMLRCTEFDGSGNVTLINGEFKKTELIQKYGLLPRDLRKVDSSVLPHILIRPSAILINLLHIRCLIQHNRVLVFDAYGSTDSYTQSVFMYDLEGKLQLKEGRTAGTLPYEFRALEAILISVTSALEGEFEGVREPVVKVLRELEENIDRDKLRHLLIYSKKLGTFEQKARLVRDALDELLEADDDLADMYLTEKAEGKLRPEDEHTEIEMLLESYHKVCDEIVQVSGNLVSNIRNTEEIVKAILDANRNSLMLLDLKFSIGTLGIGAGTFIAALYGMNLKSFIEESDWGFAGVSVTCAVFTVITAIYGLRKLRKVQRLSMWGEGDAVDRGGVPRQSREGRGNWREVDPQGQLSGEARVDRIKRWKEEQSRIKLVQNRARSQEKAQALST